MDIQKWLKNAELQTSPEELGIPSFFHGNNATVSPKYHRKRDRASSDSSLLQREPTPELLSRQHHRAKRRNPPSHTSQTDTPSSSLSASSQSDERSEHFERRPRHKTRKDLYEPHGGVRKQSRKHKDHKRKERKAQRTSKRSKKKDKPGHELIRTFKTSNVSRDRLTLPSKTLGFFKKGRASSPVRGRGLPDLVFSEMRFLQKSKEPMTSELPVLSAHEETRSKKDKRRVQEEEISSYFTSKRPPLKEKSPNIRLRKRPAIRETNDHSQCREQRREMKRSDSVRTTVELPPIELPYKPYLGFGSCGNRPHNDGSGNCATWSESAYRPGSPPFLRGTTTIDIGQLAGFRAGGAEPQTEAHSKFPTLPAYVMDMESGEIATKPKSGQVENPAVAKQCMTTVEASPDDGYNSTQHKYPHDKVDNSHTIADVDVVQTETSSPLKNLLLACDMALAVAPAARQGNYRRKIAKYIDPQRKIKCLIGPSRVSGGEQVCTREAGELHNAFEMPHAGWSIRNSGSRLTYEHDTHNRDTANIRHSGHDDSVWLREQHIFDKDTSTHSAPRNSSLTHRGARRRSDLETMRYETPTMYFMEEELMSRGESASRSFSGATSSAFTTHLFDDYGGFQPGVDQQLYLNNAEADRQAEDAFKEAERSHIAPPGFWRANKLY